MEVSVGIDPLHRMSSRDLTIIVMSLTTHGSFHHCRMYCTIGRFHVVRIIFIFGHGYLLMNKITKMM